MKQRYHSIGVGLRAARAHHHALIAIEHEQNGIEALIRVAWQYLKRTPGATCRLRRRSPFWRS